MGTCQAKTEQINATYCSDKGVLNQGKLNAFLKKYHVTECTSMYIPPSGCRAIMEVSGEFTPKTWRTKEKKRLHIYYTNGNTTSSRWTETIN